MDLFYQIFNLLSLGKVASLLRSAPALYGIVSALFASLCLLIYVFSNHRVFSFKLLAAWVISCFITLIYLALERVELDILSIKLNSQLILSFVSTTTLLVLACLSLAFKKPRRLKRYNKRTLSTRILSSDLWWVRLLGFGSSLAFCCAFNIGLFVASSLLYL